MTEEDRFKHLLRSALPPVDALEPSRDLWPSIVNRSQASMKCSWLDVNLAAVVISVLLVYPDFLWPLTYHL